jgi:hypothetical protein
VETRESHVRLLRWSETFQRICTPKHIHVDPVKAGRKRARIETSGRSNAPDQATESRSRGEVNSGKSDMTWPFVDGSAVMANVNSRALLRRRRATGGPEGWGSADVQLGGRKAGRPDPGQATADSGWLQGAHPNAGDLLLGMNALVSDLIWGPRTEAFGASATFTVDLGLLQLTGSLPATGMRLLFGRRDRLLLVDSPGHP